MRLIDSVAQQGGSSTIFQNCTNSPLVVDFFSVYTNFQCFMIWWWFFSFPICSCSVLFQLFPSGFSCRGSSAPCPSRPRASAARVRTTSSGAATTTRQSCCRTWAAAPATSAASGWLRHTPPVSPFPLFPRPSPARLLPHRARSRATRCR